MLKPEVIFIFPYSPTPWDGIRFGFDFFVHQQVWLSVLDLSALVPSRSDQGREFLHSPFIKKINSYAQFEDIVKAASLRGAIFIDCINGLAGLRYKTRHIFRIFKKYNSNYYVVELGSLPLHGTNQQKKMVNKIKKITQFAKLFKYVRWRLGNSYIDFKTRYFASHQLPKKIFVGKTELLNKYLKRYRLHDDIVTPIHSFDYDRYLDYQDRLQHPQHEKLLLPKRYAVFLDQALSNHSDFGKSISFKPVTAEKYAVSMKSAFDKIEALTGLEVVIAENPRAHYKDSEPFYGDRLMIRDKTLELVANSELVLAHNSTSINFAVLFDKPVLLLKTAEMLNAFGFNSLIDNMAHALNVKAVCVDEPGAMTTIDLQAFANWPRNYQTYMYKYVKTEGQIDKNTWQFVLDEIMENSKVIDVAGR